VTRTFIRECNTKVNELLNPMAISIKRCFNNGFRCFEFHTLEYVSKVIARHRWISSRFKVIRNSISLSFYWVYWQVEILFNNFMTLVNSYHFQSSFNVELKVNISKMIACILQAECSDIFLWSSCWNRVEMKSKKLTESLLRQLPSI
jgi:hypothetical protein